LESNLKQGISYLERVRGRGERDCDRGLEIEGRDIETEKKRDRADNKNPKQSWVAQLV
jgi:hypothetical protein